MNTQTMEQLKTLNDVTLSAVVGGDGGASLLSILLVGVYSYYANEATDSCRANPK